MENKQNNGTEIKEEITEEITEEIMDEASDIAGGRKPGVYAEYGCTSCYRRSIRQYRGNGPIACGGCGARRAMFIRFIPNP